jgi:hypothetical protein
MQVLTSQAFWSMELIIHKVLFPKLYENPNEYLYYLASAS